MTIEEIIKAKFDPVFAGRLWFDVLPKSITDPAQLQAPFAIAEQISGTERRYVDDSLHEFQSARFTFNIWGQKTIDVRAASDALRVAMAASNEADFYAVTDSGPVGDYNEVLELRGLRQDFMLTFKDPAAAPA